MAGAHAANEVCGLLNPFCSLADAGLYLSEGDLGGAFIATITAIPLTKIIKWAPKWVLRMFAAAGKFTPGTAATAALRSGTPLKFDDIAAVQKIGGQFDVVWRGPLDLAPTLTAIADGTQLPKNVFKNYPAPGKLTPELSVKPYGYYQEFVVPTPGLTTAGPMRLVIGNGGEIYFTAEHYGAGSFFRIYP